MLRILVLSESGKDLTGLTRSSSSIAVVGFVNADNCFKIDKGFAGP